MMLSVPSPRSSSRAPILPGLSLRFGDMLDGLFRIESLVDAERSVLQLAGSQVADGKPVVIQILVADGASADQARFRFMAGVRKANALKGPHVARVLDIGITPEGHPYVVREKVSARSLTSLLEEKQSFSTEEAIALALDVCDALAESHRHGLLHGDLGPRSIHLAWSKGPADVKVIDLGIAAAMAELGLAASTIESPSLHLRAPEQLQPGRTVDGRADVWGVGALLYTMLAGAPPFMADTPSSVSVAVENDEPASLAGVPDALADLVDACLAKDPAKRPASIGALAEALAAFSPDATATLARIRAHAAPLAKTIETPSVAMSPVLELANDAPESSPTIVARQGYESFAHRATRSDADTTAKRDALIRADADSSLEIHVTVEPSVRDVAATAKAKVKEEPKKLVPPRPAIRKIDTKAESKKQDLTPEPAVVVAKSVPPMVIEREMPTVIVPRRRPSWKAAGFAIAAASLAVGVVIGVSSSRLAAHAPAAAAAAAPLPAATALPKAAKELAPAQPALASTPANDLPVAAVPASALPDPKPLKPAKAKSAAPAPKPVDPLVQSASAPIQPEQKANDDDLRKFLDDRR